VSGRQFASDVYGNNRSKKQRPFEGTAPLRTRDARKSRMAKPKGDERPFRAKATW